MKEKRQISPMDSNPANIFSGKVRVRICGIIIQNDRVLLLKHKGIGKGDFLWSPPGGGLEFGENCSETLHRELKEEIGVEVEIRRFLFLNEYIDDIYHAIELFFEVEITNGEVKLGFDPELMPNQQIIQEVKWFSINEITSMSKNNIHSCFSNLNAISELLEIDGFFNFQNISIK